MEVPPVQILAREQYLTLARKLEPIGKVKWAAHYSPVEGHMVESDPDSARRQVRAALLSQAFERGGLFLVLEPEEHSGSGDSGDVRQAGRVYRRSVASLSPQEYSRQQSELELLGTVSERLEWRADGMDGADSCEAEALGTIRRLLFDKARMLGADSLVLAKPTLDRGGVTGLIEQNGQAYRKKGGSGQ